MLFKVFKYKTVSFLPRSLYFSLCFSLTVQRHTPLAESVHYTWGQCHLSQAAEASAGATRPACRLHCPCWPFKPQWPWGIPTSKEGHTGFLDQEQIKAPLPEQSPVPVTVLALGEDSHHDTPPWDTVGCGCGTPNPKPSHVHAQAPAGLEGNGRIWAFPCWLTPGW